MGARGGWGWGSRGLGRAAVWVAAGVLAGALAACVDVAQVKATRDQAALVRESLAGEVQTLRERLESMPADDPGRGELTRQLESSRTALESLNNAVGEVDKALAASEAAPSVGDAAGSIAAFLPEPWRAPLILGAGLAAAVWRARQLKASLRSVVAGIETAKREDDAFKARFAANANIFRATQTTLARKVVDEVASGGLCLPI